MTGKAPVAIVTGGSGGLAPGIARALRDAGHMIVLVARDGDRLDQSASALMRGTSSLVDAIVCDVTDRTAVAAMAMSTFDRFGRIDLLVNAAASSNPIGGPIEQVDVDLLIDDLDTKVGGYLRCIQAVVPAMKRQKRGRIVNIGGLTGRSSDTLSGLRNAAVTHMTKVMADQLGPFGITVNAVHPGITRTPHLEELFDGMAQERGTDRAAIEDEFVGQIPTRRLCEPEEIGDAIAFLASPAARSINGESIAIDGGYSRGVYL